MNAYGTQNVTPTDSTTYHLVARGPGGSTDATARLTVTAAAAPPSTGENIDENVFEQNVKPAFFDYDSYEIRPDAQTILAQDASYLAAHPTLKVVIGGYCDDRGIGGIQLGVGRKPCQCGQAGPGQWGHCSGSGAYGELRQGEAVLHPGR